MAIVGAGIIGMTCAVVLLENGFDVTIYTKEDPLSTNSDAAVATWFAPDDQNPVLQQLCLESFSKFEELLEKKTPGVSKIQQKFFFKNKADFGKSVWAKESVRKLVKVQEITEIQSELGENLFAMNARIFLINPNFYRPYLLEQFKYLGGKLKKELIHSLDELMQSYPVVINCSGWEAKYLTEDKLVHPIRGQTEIITMLPKIENQCSINVEHKNMYVVFRPGEDGKGDCVVGTTFQPGNSSREPSVEDQKEILNKGTGFFPLLKKYPTTSKVGIRAGRKQVRIEGKFKNHTLMVHCYGHGGSGYSDSWSSANKVLEYCNTLAGEQKNSSPRI